MYSFLIFVMLLSTASAQIADLDEPCDDPTSCINSADNTVGLECDNLLSTPVCAIKVTQSCAGKPDKCVTGAKCTSGTNVCECTVTGYEDRNSILLCKVIDGKIGGICTNDASCGANSNAKCLYSKCTCNNGYSAPDGASVCIQDGKIGGKCTDDPSCGTNSNANCPSGTLKCTCNTGYSAPDGASVCTKPAEGGAASAVVSTVTLLLSAVIALRCFL